MMNSYENDINQILIYYVIKSVKKFMQNNTMYLAFFNEYKINKSKLYPKKKKIYNFIFITINKQL